MRYNERSDCVKTLIKLKQQEMIMKKALELFLDSLKLEPEILRMLRSERRCDEKSANSLRASALEITNDLRAIKSAMNGLQDGHKIDVDSFRAKLIILADKIRELKKNCTIDDLTREEIELDRWLHEFSVNSAKHGTRGNSTTAVSREFSRKSSNVGADHQDYRDVRDFEALIAKTGHTQSWSSEDHLFFLKARKTARNVPAMVAAIRKKCPDLTAERIVNHEAWYKIYLDLREKQRQNVREWRDRRESERRRKFASTKDAEDAEKSTPTRERKSSQPNVENAATEKSAEQEPRKSSSEKCSRAEKSSASQKREVVARWRARKENARVLENERMKSESEARRISEENRRLARAKQLRQAVNFSHREKKMEAENSLASSSTTSATDYSDRTTAKFQSVKFIESFRRQDAEFAERRKNLLASRKPSASGLVQRKIHERPGGPSTLLKPTKVWLEKCRQGENRLEQTQQVLYVKDIPKLATCDWRNRESSGNARLIPS